LERFHSALDEHLAAIGVDLAALDDRTLAAVFRGAFGERVGAGTAGFHLQV